MKESFRAIECKLPGGRCLIFIGTEGGVSLGLSTGAVNSYLGRARMVGLNWPLADEFSDAELETLLYPPPPELAAERRPVPDWAKLAKVPPAKQVECQMRGWCIASCGGRM